MTVRTVQRWIADGRLQATRVGSRVRVSRSSLASVTDGAAAPRPAGAITSLLIANRGEIAVRVARTARRMGIRVIGVHAADDRAPDGVGRVARHRLLPRRRDELLERRPTRRAPTAIHPGYGFLAESAPFARRGDRRRPDAGSDHRRTPSRPWATRPPRAGARRRRASRPLPGYDGDAQDDGTLIDEAGRIGYPLLVKPSLGGGGKGMRVVSDPSALAEALAGRAPRGAPVVRRRSAHPRALPRRARGTSRCRSCSTRTAAACTSASATAARSGATRRSSRRRRRRRSRPSCASGWARRRWQWPRASGYVSAGTVEMLLTDARRVLLPRDEHAPPGRAPRHRGRHRPRPGRPTSCASPPGRRWRSSACRGRLASGATRSRRASTPRTRSRASCRRPGTWRACAGRRASASTPASARATRSATATTRCWPSSSPTARPGATRSTACGRRSARRPSSASAPTCASCAG